MESIWTILSSAGVAAIVSSIASYVINTLMQKRRFRDDYYKMVIEKRMAAYQGIEDYIRLLKTSVLDKTDGKPYNAYIFGKTIHEFYEMQAYLAQLISQSLWLSESMIEALEELQQHILTIEEEIQLNKKTIQSIGKSWYNELGKTRKKIAKCLMKDLRDMVDVEGFLKGQRHRESVYYEITKQKE